MNCENQCYDNGCHHFDLDERYGINVTALAHTQEPLLIEQAIELVPEEMRKPGTKISFWTFDGWQSWQFQSMDIREWLLPESWSMEAFYDEDKIQDLQSQIDSIQIGGWAVSQQFGYDTHIGISQKALTEAIGYDDSQPNTVRGRIAVIEDEIGTDTSSQTLSGRITALEQAVGTGGSVDSRINAAKTQIIGGASNEYNTLGKVQAKIEDEVSARTSTVSAEVTRAQAAESRLNDKINIDVNTEKMRAMGEEELLRQAYEAISQFEPIIGTLPSSGMTGKVYRVPGETSYADYMWNGSSFVKMAQYDNAIDDKPIEASENLVKSGGVNSEFADAYASIYSPEDLYSYTPQTGIIDSNNRWNTVHNSHLIIPLSGISKIVYTTTSSEYGVVIAFLKTYNISETNPDFSALYPSRIYVDADKSVKYDVPADAAYLYLANSTSYVNDVRKIEELRLIRKQDAAEDRTKKVIKTDVPRGFVVEKNKTVSIDLSADPPYVHVVDSETQNIVYVYIEDGVTRLIPVNGVAGRYRFFNTYNKIDVDSYINATDTTSGSVPEGAKYAAILFSNASNPNGLDNLIIKTEPDVIGTINDVSKMLNNETEELDLSGLPEFGFIINSKNVYSRIPVSSPAEGRVVALSSFASHVTIVASGERNAAIAFLKDTAAVGGAVPNFADGYERLYSIIKGKTIRYKLNSTCKYLYFTKTSTAGYNTCPTVTVEYSISGNTGSQKKELNILFIGSSGEQDMIAYLPPVLNEVLYDYDITYADMYKSGAQASNYVTMYKTDTACEDFNMWTPDSISWDKNPGMILEDVLELRTWNLIVMKGNVTGCRQLMRIIQSIVTYPVTFATVSNIPRVYDNLWESVTDSAKSRCRSAGFVGWIPVATGMENARSNDILKMTGMASCPEPTEFTIPAGKYFSFYHKIRTGTGIPVAILKATRISGTGTVEIYASDSATASDHLVFTLNDNLEHSAEVGYEAKYIKIVNNGSIECVVKFEDSQYTKVVGYDEQEQREIRIGDYMLYSDNQHTQAGIPTLISAYVIALKILEWTGNANRGICGSSFIPTIAELKKINAANASGVSSGLGHGYSCGVENYIGSDGNTYDRSQLTLFDGTLYVTTTVFNNTPDANSVSAVLDNNNPINYNNVYAAQEVAMLSVKYPDELTDCSNIVIDVPAKNTP